MCEIARANPGLQDLETLISSIQTACKTINSLVQRAHITGLVGYADGGGSINIQGEEQKTLDIMTNDVLKKALRFTGKMGVIASEEEDNPVDVLDDEGLGSYDKRGDALMDETGRYTAVFDPLDGSSNVDAGIPTGTIFGIFEDNAECIIPEEACTEDFNEPTPPDDCEISEVSQQCLTATLQPGTSLVASGYCLYSSSTFFCLTLGAGVQIFTLDTQIGEFVLTHPNVQIPSRGAIYSMNEANRQQWDAPLRAYIEALQKGEGETEKRYSSRYIGSMVGDVHRTLLYGGTLLPADSKNRNGSQLLTRPRLGHLVEQAGGLALTGKTRIMDLLPQTVHQRVPVILGSPEDVREMRKYYDAFTGSDTMDQDSEEARMIRERCFTRLTPGQLLDTTMDKMADSIAVDSTGDGKVDKIVKLAEAEKLD